MYSCVNPCFLVFDVALPDRFKCVVTNWDYIYGLCRKVADDVKDSSYEPDTILALARGGWFAGRVLCDFLGLDDLTSLKIEHYVGTAAAGDHPEIKYPLADGAVEGKRVLIVDDIADTGKSFVHSKKYVEALGPHEVRTAGLQLLDTSVFEPDYIGEELAEWAWVVYPWNFIEDMTDLISRLMAKEKKDWWDEDTIKAGLYQYHRLEPISFEISHPGRIPEIMREMERRGDVKSRTTDHHTEWSLKR